MKKIMLFTLGCLACASLVLMAFTSKQESADEPQPYVMLEIYEVPNYPDRGVHIHYGNNRRDFIPFKGMKVEDHDDAGDITLSAINKLVAEGYYIESSSAGLAQSGMITKIFMRKK
jgi:hypothetical protein